MKTRQGSHSSVPPARESLEDVPSQQRGRRSTGQDWWSCRLAREKREGQGGQGAIGCQSLIVNLSLSMKPLIQNFARTQIVIYRTTEFSCVVVRNRPSLPASPARLVSLCFLSTLPTSSTPLRLEGVGVDKCLSLPKGTIAG